MLPSKEKAIELGFSLEILTKLSKGGMGNNDTHTKQNENKTLMNSSGESVLELDSKVLKVLIHSFNKPSLDAYYVWVSKKCLGN